MIAALHDSPVTVERNGFIHKSLSCWSVNPFMGCGHGCRFCYVADTSVNKQKRLLGSFGVRDAVADWGDYVLVRPWDEKKFRASLQRAEQTAVASLNADGNRAIFFSSTTDPYQAIRHPDPEKRRLLNGLARANVRRALEMIRDESTLNVRILTRSALARKDFDVLRSFGNRMLLGSSIPTLDPVLARIYEPNVPAPRRRLELLRDAHKTGIPVYAAVAPVFPEVSREGLLGVFRELKAVNPVTVFMEPVNIRLGIASRIEEEAKRVGIPIDMRLYQDRGKWADYAIHTLRQAEACAEEAGLADRLHLWPDAALNTRAVLARQQNPVAHVEWLESWWSRISEWPVGS